MKKWKTMSLQSQNEVIKSESHPSSFQVANMHVISETFLTTLIQNVAEPASSPTTAARTKPNAGIESVWAPDVPPLPALPVALGATEVVVTTPAVSSCQLKR
jgi:hypothetical protein